MFNGLPKWLKHGSFTSKSNIILKLSLTHQATEISHIILEHCNISSRMCM